MCSSSAAAGKLRIHVPLYTPVMHAFVVPAQAHKPRIGFEAPLVPLLMSTSILGSSVLMMSLGKLAIMRFGIVIGIVIVLYFVYGVHTAARHAGQVSQFLVLR